MHRYILGPPLAGREAVQSNIEDINDEEKIETTRLDNQSCSQVEGTRAKEDRRGQNCSQLKENRGRNTAEGV
jgi:hypothetical protein